MPKTGHILSSLFYLCFTDYPVYLVCVCVFFFFSAVGRCVSHSSQVNFTSSVFLRTVNRGFEVNESKRCPVLLQAKDSTWSASGQAETPSSRGAEGLKRGGVQFCPIWRPLTWPFLHWGWVVPAPACRLQSHLPHCLPVSRSIPLSSDVLPTHSYVRVTVPDHQGS